MKYLVMELLFILISVVLWVVTCNVYAILYTPFFNVLTMLGATPKETNFVWIIIIFGMTIRGVIANLQLYFVIFKS